MGDPEGPEERARVHWSLPPPPPGGESAPPSTRNLGEEFLFHLYRGSELLKDDQVYEAKNELERALSMQPRDVEGQSLLGVVYFRLGHYPRAIQIYEELVRVRPQEVAPRVNLALCYLKTGLLPSARALLEEVVHHRPDHVRAWGYLGLVYQRLGADEKAAVAFDRAGRPQMAARVRAAQSVPPPPPEGLDPAPAAPPPEEPRRADVHEISQQHAQGAPSLPPPPLAAERKGSAHPLSGIPAGGPPAVAVPVGRLAREVAVDFPDQPRLAVRADGAVVARVAGAFHCRADCVRAVSPDAGTELVQRPTSRRARGGPGADEPLGGVTSPFVTVDGTLRVLLGVPEPFAPLVATVQGEPFYVREERLLGFEGSLEHESGRIALPEGGQTSMVHLSGSGAVALSVRGPLQSLQVSAEHGVEVRATRLVGWIGRLVARPARADDPRSPLRGFVSLSGDGVVLLDGR